jgi:hypothetical protein
VPELVDATHLPSAFNQFVGLVALIFAAFSLFRGALNHPTRK